MMRRRPVYGLLLGPALACALQSVAFADPGDERQAEVATLRAQIQLLEQRNALQQRDIETLRRRLEQLLGPASAAPPAGTPLGAGVGAGTSAAIAAPQQPQAPSGSVSTAQRPPVQSSVENIYQGQNALFSHGWTVTPTYTQAYSDSHFFTLNGFMALGAVFLGNINVSQQKSTISIFELNTTYGLTPRLQLSATLPYLSRTTSYSSVGANTSSATPSEVNSGRGGLGDASIGVFYQARAEDARHPNVILNGQLTIPTGRSPYGIKLAQDAANSNLQYPSALPTGQGVYGLSGGVTLVKTIDPAIFFGGVNYYYNIPAGFADLSTDPNTVTPGLAVPGNAIAYNVGTAFALNERTSLSFGLQDTMTGSTRVKPAGQPWQTVVGSTANAAMLNVGLSYAINRQVSWAAQLGIGLTRDAPDFQLTMKFPRKY